MPYLQSLFQYLNIIFNFWSTWSFLQEKCRHKCELSSSLFEPVDSFHINCSAISVTLRIKFFSAVPFGSMKKISSLEHYLFAKSVNHIRCFAPFYFSSVSSIEILHYLRNLLRKKIYMKKCTEKAKNMIKACHILGGCGNT